MKQAMCGEVRAQRYHPLVPRLSVPPPGGHTSLQYTFLSMPA